MEKHRISPDEYRAILNKLKELAAIEENHYQGRMAAVELATQQVQKRSTPRSYLFFTISIFDANDPRYRGIVNDISEKGFQVQGMPVNVGDVKTFVIRSDVFTVEPPFLCQASCRWTDDSGPGGQTVAGFQITGINPENLQRLRKLIKDLTIR